MIKVNDGGKPTDCSLFKDVFEKFGERRLFSRGEYFAHSGEVMNMPVGLFQVASNTRLRLQTKQQGY